MTWSAGAQQWESSLRSEPETWYGARLDDRDDFVLAELGA